MHSHTVADCEREIRAAMGAGNWDQVEHLAGTLDHVEQATRRPPVTLGAAALWYAEQGVPTFALRPGRKHPFGGCREQCREISGQRPRCPGPHMCGHDQCHGLSDATTDPDRMNRWWQATPQANIGLATGHLFDIVDIDGPAGQASRMAHWDDIFAAIDTDSIGKVSTPRPGGMHIYVPATGEGNSTQIVTDVDYRGIGGYCIGPPSVIAPGGADSPGAYTWLVTPTLAA